MAKVTEYPRITKMKDNDILLVDGPDGTRTILQTDASKQMGGEVIMVNETAGDSTKVVINTTGEDIELALMADLAPVEEDVEELKTQYELTLTKNAISGDYAAFSNGVAGTEISPFIVNINSAQGSSGWTAAKVTRCGKNLLDPDITGYVKGTNYQWKKGVVPEGVVAIMSFRDKDTTVNVSDIFVGFSADDLSAQALPTKYRWCMQNGVITSDCSNIARNDTITCSNVAIYPKTDDAFNRLFARYDIQVEIGTAITDFEPYAGDIYNISFPSAAGTVHSGVLNLTEGTLSVGSTTPVVYTLDPVSVTALAGHNIVWADCGSVEIEYVLNIGDTLAGIAGNIAELEKNSKDDLRVTLNGTDVTIVSKFGDGELVRTLNIRNTGNKMFEFMNATIAKNGEQTLIKSSTDDVTPLRLKGGTTGSWPIGANHGWFAIKVAKGALTTADIGSRWSSDGSLYTLAQVDDANAYFIPAVTLSNHVYNFSNAIPASNLVHSSGATHTGTVSISGAESAQLYPSVNKHTIKYLKDGQEFDTNSFWCSHFTVIEEYNIIDYASIGAYLNSHIGSEIGDDIEGCVRVSVSCDFVGSACIITTCYKTLKPINYINCGIIQAGPVNVSGTNHRYFYVNNQSDEATLKSATLLDTTSYTDQISIDNANAIDPDVATNRFVEIVKDNGGNMLYGFATGYLPDISDGADDDRKTILSQGEFRSNTMKCYPKALVNKNADADDVFTICAYRNYIEPSELTNVSLISANNAAYLIIDAHAQQNAKSISLPAKYIGKEITVLESHNFTLKSDVVSACGVTFSTSSAYGCAILKIK